MSDVSLDPAAVLNEVLPPILAHSRCTPAFKYLHGSGLLDDAGELRWDATLAINDRVREYVSHVTDRYMPPPSYVKAASRVLRHFSGYQEFARRRIPQ